MNETFIRLVAALAFCDAPEPGHDEHAHWTAVLQAIYRLRDSQAHGFLAAINLSGLPNESPPALLLRAHRHAKALLPKLVVELREAKAKAETETNHNRFLRSQAESDPFIDGANLTRDAFAGRGEAEPRSPHRWMHGATFNAEDSIDNISVGQLTVRTRMLLVPPLEQPRLPVLPEGV